MAPSAAHDMIDYCLFAAISIKANEQTQCCSDLAMFQCVHVCLTVCVSNGGVSLEFP